MKTTNLLKIYGERNTGTNYLIRLLKKNYKEEISMGVVPRGHWRRLEFTKDLYYSLTIKKNLGWKHGYIDMTKIEDSPIFDSTGFITLSKNPYSFLLSLYKRPYAIKGKKPDSFFEFIQKPWGVRGRENYHKKAFKNPIQMWNEKNKSYILFNEKFPDKVLTLKYENFLNDFSEQLTQVENKFSIQSINKHENLTASTKKDPKTYDDYKNYYLNRKYLEEFSAEELSFISSELDPDVLKYFGYDFQ